MKRFKTLAEFKRAHKNDGGHFFDRKTMSFFNSRIETGLLRDEYFITSEQFVSSTGIADKRKYTIRQIDGLQVKTVSDFNTITSLSKAKEILFASVKWIKQTE